MTNEEIIEEILYKAHTKGIRKEVLVRINTILDNNPKINFYEAVSMAYKVEKEILKNGR